MKTTWYSVIEGLGFKLKSEILDYNSDLIVPFEI
jgi:hypothetical protein